MVALWLGMCLWLAQPVSAAPGVEDLDAQAEQLHQEGRFAEAEALARRALALQEQAPGSDHGEVGDRLGSLGALRLSQGDFDDARSLYEQSLAILEAQLGSDHPRVAASLNGLATALRLQGDFDRARPLFDRALAINERSLGLEDPEVAATLNNLAQLLEAQGDLAGARPLYERSLAIRKKALGADHFLVAVSLNNLAVLLRGQGDLGAARPLCEQSLAIMERAKGPNHPDVAAALNNLASVLDSQGDYDSARPLYERALAIREEALGSEHPDLAVSCFNLASLEHTVGAFEAARPLYERTLAIFEQVLGLDHPLVATVLNSLGDLLRDQGDYEGARARFDRSLAIREKALGPDHPDLAFGLNSLGLLYRIQGDDRSARPLFTRSLAILENALGPEHPTVAQGLNNLALLLQAQGDYHGARPLLERSLAIVEKALGPDHNGVATALNNLAALLRAQGDLDGARPLFERSVEISEEALGPDHPEVATSLDNLAGLLELQGAFDQARALYERSLDIRERRLGPDHIAVASNLGNLAGLLASMGDHEGARPLYERSLDIRERAFGSDHVGVATDLNNLAHILQSEGDLDAARQLFEKGLDITERALGSDHPQVGSGLLNLARLLLAQGETADARRRLDTSLSIREARLDLLDTMSEREAFAYVADSRATFDAWLGAFDAPGDAARAWSTTLRWKGVATRRLRDRLSGDALEEPALRDLHQRLRHTRAELARVTYADYDAEKASERRERQLDLTHQKEDLERQLAAASAAWRGARAVEQAGAREVCGALANGTGLVDFLRSGDAYFAFAVVSPACEVRRIHLGEAATIDAHIAAWRVVLTGQATAVRGTTPLLPADGGEESAEVRGSRVRERLWDPLQHALDGATRLIVVPDGALSAVPFGALPLSDGTFLVEHTPLAILDSAQDLLRAPSSRPTAGALLVGDVDFGRADAPAPTPRGASRAAPCVDGTFAPLPGTATEVESIAARWARSRHRDEPAVSLVSATASEEAVRQALTGRRVVHLATHGFFATGRCRSALGGGGAFGDRQTVVGYSPMLLSGVVLAGANAERDPLAVEDGILTAEELAGVDLRGTELVVLSACETGLGEVHSGEGVLGLRRALSLAGAESQIMSLWSVPDEATSALMRGFYAKVLHRRRPQEPSTSLRAAQLDMLQSNGERFAEPLPGTWAAFVASGVPGWARAQR